MYLVIRSFEENVLHALLRMNQVPFMHNLDFEEVILKPLLGWRNP